MHPAAAEAEALLQTSGVKLTMMILGPLQGSQTPAAAPAAMEVALEEPPAITGNLLGPVQGAEPELGSYPGTPGFPSVAVPDTRAVAAIVLLQRPCRPLQRWWTAVFPAAVAAE